MFHIGQERMFLTLYMQRLLLTKQTRFKAVRVPLGPKQTIFTWLGAGHYKWYQSRSPTPMWGFVWLCLFGPAIPWDTTRTLCLHGGGGGGVFVMSHIGLLLTKQMRFKAVRVPLGPKRTISTWLSVGRYILCGPCARHLDFQFIRLFLSKFNFNCL